MWNQVTQFQFFGNNGVDYLIALLIFFGLLIGLKIFRHILFSRLALIAKRTTTVFDDFLLSVLKDLKPFFYSSIALYFSLRSLNLNDTIDKYLGIFIMMVLVFEGIRAAVKIVGYFTYQAIKKDNNDKQAKASVKTLNIFVQVILWSFGSLLILSNAGVNVTSLIAGLGIGGIAVALALQNILGDIFSSFSILIDKPFQTGDYIKVGNDTGTVEKIGIKTTRLKTLDGQTLIISNKELTTARVENFKQMEKRRAVFSLGLVYQTSQEKLELVPKLIKEIVESQAEAELDRCNFKSFASFSLDFEIVFYAKVASYNEYLEVLEKVNLAIFKRFKEAEIEFAYPTNLQYIKQD